MKFCKTIICRLIHKSWKKHIHIEMNGFVSHKSILEGYNSFGANTYFQGNIGIGSYIANNTILFATQIGRFCSIGSRVNMTNSTHPIVRFSTSPSFYSVKPANGLSFVTTNQFEDIRYLNNDEKISINIGNDVWICDDVTLIGPINIGDGAIIAAGAVVTQDVPPFSIVGGVPAKVIRYRFSDETIKKIKESEWWLQDLCWIKENHDYLELLCKSDSFKNCL